MMALLLLLVLLLAYAWIGYPIVLAWLVRGRDSPGSSREGGGLAVDAPVAILLSAYNEERVIRARLENLVDCTAPIRERATVDVFVGIDGATDETAEIARSVAAEFPFIHVQAFHERRGKVAVLKELVEISGRDAKAPGDGVIVFTDANTRFGRMALDRLLAPLADPRVGGVSGRLVFIPAGSSGTPTGEDAYWRWETGLKMKESALDSCLGANGAIYAIRRSLFWGGIPDNTIVDDFVIGMKVREQGFRMLYEPEATAEEPFPAVQDEWRRRVRIGSGDFQALWLCRRCLSPRFGFFAWSFWSHKVFRWLTPHAILLILVLSVAACLIGKPPGAVMGVLCLAGLGIVLGGAAAGRFAQSRHLRACYHFAMMQAALFAGFLRFCRGGLRGSWERTPR